MTAKYSFRKYQPVSLRLWHWLNALAILGLLSTVLLRKTFLSWRANSALIENKLQAVGTTITPEVAKDIAVSIRDPMWDWHIYLGFALAALILFRILIGLFVVKKCPAGQSVKSTWNIFNVDKSERLKAFHFAGVKISYAMFYLATVFMVSSGLTMNFKNELGLSKDQITPIKELHELMMWFFVGFVVLHIAGVVLAELRDEPGVVSDMINGGDKE
ncbi:MAG: cytochrome b/b6 domain-containing protein [Bdellovibrio sp.]|nr:cytochrome b/b6 domain-containing protein [Bdellovibrio sp.]